MGAENGRLINMVGGKAAHYKKARVVMDAYAKAVNLMGPAVCGQLTKMVNQICILGVVQSLSEGINFAKRAGHDPFQVIEVVSEGAARSFQMDMRAKTMIEGKFNFGFAVDLMRKDIGICLDEANRNGAPLPITAIIDQFYKDIQVNGGGRLDNTALVKRLYDMPGARSSMPKPAMKSPRRKKRPRKVARCKKAMAAKKEIGQKSVGLAITRFLERFSTVLHQEGLSHGGLFLRFKIQA